MPDCLIAAGPGTPSHAGAPSRCPRTYSGNSASAPVDCLLFGPWQLHRKENCPVIILGVLLLLVGWLTGLSILYTVGSIVLIVGIVFFILGNVGRPVGGRKVWF
jgi:hypothetical protein